MYSIKKNIQLLVATLQAYNIRHIVLSPGSRNAPLIHTLEQHPFFKCNFIVDERSAAYFALGIIQREKAPVAVCCTSGTALLNYAPAVAEAYYQQLPLIVISADRSPAWIGQMDGQTIPQNNILSAITKKSVHLPEINTDEEAWFCQRLIHEALLGCNQHGKGPVHINIPISEPLFDFSAETLPVIKPIRNEVGNGIDIKRYSAQWQKSSKRMIVIGQLEADNNIAQLIYQLTERFDCVVLAEHLSNIKSDSVISNFDLLIHSLSIEDYEAFCPDLLITFGGHIVSKRLKQYLRNNEISEHWHITESGDLIDLFQSLTDLVETNPGSFIEGLIESDIPLDTEKRYRKKWESKAKELSAPKETSIFSDLFVTGYFIENLPDSSVLHLANSSSVRNAQLYPIRKNISVFCNRGANGIDGSLSTASGFASDCDRIVFLLIGDLSFFYDFNALFYGNVSSNLRILLINNGGGAIFHQLPVPQKTETFDKYIAARNTERAADWIANSNIEYLSAQNKEELKINMSKFVSEKSNKPILFEVFTSMDDTTLELKEYYNQLKK